jgi:S-adenosylmethionine hydrolase
LARRPTTERHRLVTLTSDVGSAYAAQMKAALIAGGVAPGRLVDLAHDLPPHGVREAAFLLREMARSFPTRSVHLVVVDPGVGGRRSAIVVTTRAGPLLVGPDNGVLLPLADELGIRIVHRIDPRKLPVRKRVGTTFDGRDLFAPAAAVLAGGGRPQDLGLPVVPTPFSLPPPRREKHGAQGEVLHVDRFGNLITNIPSAWVPDGTTRLGVRIGSVGRPAVPWVASYEALGPGKLGTLGSSFGLVEVALREGRASDRLDAGVGTPVVLSWRARPSPRGANANSAA